MKKMGLTLCALSMVFGLFFSLTGRTFAVPNPEVTGWFSGVAYVDYGGPLYIYMKKMIPVEPETFADKADEDVVDMETSGEREVSPEEIDALSGSPAAEEPEAFEEPVETVEPENTEQSEEIWGSDSE